MEYFATVSSILFKDGADLTTSSLERSQKENSSNIDLNLKPKRKICWIKRDINCPKIEPCGFVLKIFGVVSNVFVIISCALISFVDRERTCVYFHWPVRRPVRLILRGITKFRNRKSLLSSRPSIAFKPKVDCLKGNFDMSVDFAIFENLHDA